MGAGEFLAGEGLAGQDPVDTSGRVVPSLVASIKFDPYDRAYPQNADLQLAGDHAVIHRAAHLLGIPAGSIPAVPTMGIELDELRTATSATAPAIAAAKCAKALAPLIDAGDLKILSVDVPLPYRGQWFCTVQNLRDPNSRPVTLKAGRR